MLENQDEVRQSPKVTNPSLVFAVGWLKQRRDAIYNAFKTRLFSSKEESNELINELAEIEAVLEGEE